MLLLTVAWNRCLEGALTIGVGRLLTEGAALSRDSTPFTPVEIGADPDDTAALKAAVDRLARLGLVLMALLAELSLCSIEEDKDLQTSPSDNFLLSITLSEPDFTQREGFLGVLGITTTLA